MLFIAVLAYSASVTRCDVALWLSESNFKTAIYVYLLELPTFDCKFSLSLGSVDALLHCHIISSLMIGCVSISVLPYTTTSVSLQNLLHLFVVLQ